MNNIKKQNKYELFICGLILLFMLYPTTVFANSSWHWVTISPKRLLPVAAVLTLTVEVVGAVAYGGVRDKLRALFIVAFVNIVSFLAPYIERTNRFKAVAGGFISAWDKAFNSGPYYMVGLGFLIITLCIELPLAYFLLKNYTKKRKQLFFGLIMTNVITTAGVAVIERLFCHGQW